MEEKKMREFLVYEHIKGLPDFLDSINEEITELVMENNYSEEKDVEWLVRHIEGLNPTDRFGRTRNLYVFWID